MTTYGNPSKNDIIITDPSTGNLIGFNVKREDGVPAWMELDADYLTARIYTDAANVDQMNPEEEIHLVQSDWRNGAGQDVYDPGSPKRYADSLGMDLRRKGMALAGWGATAIAMPGTIASGATLQNTTFEAASDWTNGAQSVAQAHGGTNSWGVSGTEAYQDAATWAAAWQSKTFTFGCWVWADSANEARIGINDGVTSTYSSYHAGNSAWAFMTVTKTISASATRVRCLLKDETAGNSYFDDAVLGSPVIGVAACHATFNSLEYLSAGRLLFKLNGTGNGWTEVASFNAAITSLTVFQVSGVDYLFIFLGTSTDYWYMTAAEVFAISTAAVKTFQKSTWVNTTADTIYANDGVNTIRSTTNPLNGGTAWSAQTIVGSAADSITHLQEKDGALLIDKEDKPYYLSSTGAVQKDLAPECSSANSTTSGANSTIWQGEYFRPTGEQALLQIGTTNTWINPAISYSTRSATAPVGRVYAVAGDEEYLYAVANAGTYITILAGRDEVIDSTTVWVWHPIFSILTSTPFTACQTAWISTVYQKRLWFTSTVNTESIYYLPLPTKYGDITNDSNRAFLTGTSFTTPLLHGNFKADTKAWLRITLTMGHTYNAGRYFTVAYQKFGATSWTSIGNFAGSSTSMVESKYIPVDGGGLNPFSTMMAFRFTAVTDDTTITPILLSYDAKAILYPLIKKVYLTTVVLGEGVSSKLSGRTGDNLTLQQNCLANCRVAGFPVTVTEYISNSNGSTFYAKFLPLPQSQPRRRVVRYENNRPVEWEYTLLMLSADSTLGGISAIS